MLSHTDIKFFKMAVGQSAIGKETNIDISARCPICGDSKKSKRAKRLHLYVKNGETLVHCFNGDCEVHNNMYNFIKLYRPSLLEAYKRETFGSTLHRLRGEEQETLKTKRSKLKTWDFSKVFKDIETSPDGISYVASRNVDYKSLAQSMKPWFYSENDLKIDGVEYKTAKSVVVPLYIDGEIYGFYSRKTHEKQFATFMFDDNIGYKLWNHFNVDPSQPVWIFEGIFDALNSGKKNVVAAIGAKIPKERISEYEQPIFVLDNDTTGIKNSIEMAEAGYEVFVWPDGIKCKDIGELSKTMKINEISDMITSNLFKGLSAVSRLKLKLK